MDTDRPFDLQLGRERTNQDVQQWFTGGEFTHLNPRQPTHVETVTGTGEGNVSEASVAVVDRARHHAAVPSSWLLSLGEVKSSAIFTCAHSRPLASRAVET